MGETTTQFVSRISVKDLISAFESKSDTVRVEFSRPRAKSFGNVLSKNVTVRLHEYTTFEDVENGLAKLETSLNFYEAYNKEKHVTFQEQFFNILTSIANIENNDEDAPARKKALISRTQMLVSFLNQKLPSNINQAPEAVTQHKYVPYSAVKNKAPEPSRNVETSTGAQPSLYIESGGTVNVTNSGNGYVVSVKKLKENFQVVTKSSTQEETVKTKQVTNKPVPEQAKPVEDVVKKEADKVVSVSKLRSLFEQSSEENSKGLEIITVEKPELVRNALGGSIQNINIPYTERNLGTLRMQRSVSGNYMNYSGLLNRVDINRSSSTMELGTENNVALSDSSDESDTGSDDSYQNRNQPVNIQDIIKKYASIETEPIVEDYSARAHITLVRKTGRTEVKYSSNIDKEESYNDVQSVEEAKVSSMELQAETKEESVKVNAAKQAIEEMELATHQGFEEIEVNTGTTFNTTVKVEEMVASIENRIQNAPNGDSSSVNDYIVDEVEEPEDQFLDTSQSGCEDDEKIVTESIPGIDDGSDSDASSDTIGDTGKEYSYNLKEDDANDTNFEEGAVEATGVELETANDHQTESAPELKSGQTESAVTNGYKENDTGDENPTNNTDHPSLTSSIYDLEDQKEQSLIEEVMEKIDVDQTLANADLIVNLEDLKNVDDEFEKLMEKSDTGKSAT